MKVVDRDVSIDLTAYHFFPSSFTEIKLTYNSVEVQHNNLTYIYCEMTITTGSANIHLLT